MWRIVSATVVIVMTFVPWVIPAARATLPGSNGLIAFAVDGEIYTMNADGSGVTQLTDGPKEKAFPAWNGDGSMLALTTYSPRTGRTEIGTLQADGSGLETFDAPGCSFFDPAWGPDGTKLAFFGYCNAGDRVWTSNADGTGRTKFTHIQALFPTWSPDGTRIAFVHSEQVGNRFRTDVYVQEIATGAVTQLTANRGEESDLDWSPDGTSIAFTAYEGIFTVAVDGSGRTRVTTATEPGEFHAHPAWAPDGSTLLFTRFLDTDGDFEGDAAQIWSIDPDGANLVQLTPDDMFALMPAWQPVP